jgi:hypothetical protein
MQHRFLSNIVLAISASLLFSCASPPVPGPQLLAPTEEQMKLRSFQSRSFDGTSRKQAMRGVIGTLQDLGFIIERANEPLGLVTAERFAEPDFYSVVGVTVTVREQGEGRVMIRANAIFNNAPVDDPEPYQNFFAALERSLFINRN